MGDLGTGRVGETGNRRQGETEMGRNNGATFRAYVMDIEQFRNTVRARRVEWRKHVLQRLAERRIRQGDVLDYGISNDIVFDLKIFDKTQLNETYSIMPFIQNVKKSGVFI